MTIKRLRWPMQLITAVALGAVGLGVLHTLYGAEAAVLIAPPAQDNPRAAGEPQTAVLAGGCFWGVQGVFQHLRGVQKVVSGYAGGDKGTAQYETVGSGRTGHAESVSVTFDPAQVSYGQILQVALSVVFDPTQLNRQGPDYGSQYRSVFFYADDTQKRIAEAYIAQLDKSHAFPRPIVTQVAALKGFYPAEDYHQDFLVLHPTSPYIVYNDLPKVENFKRVFPALYSERPVLVGAR